MQKLFPVYKATIEDFLRTFLQQKRKELANVNPWGSDVCKRFLKFSLQGKMIRGCLTILGYEMFTNQSSNEVVKLAAAMEIFQSALLIHDDIMDRDTMRRGAKTIFAQYGENHFGESMGICVGDIGFFFAFELLADIPKIHTLVAKELTNVGIAQMQDVSFGHQTAQPSETALLSLYRYKTARYTFSLPLMIGATLAEQPPKTIKALETLGEDLGIMFQLKDDQLDVVGDRHEGKKTLLQLYGEKRTNKKISDLSEQVERLIAELPIDKKWQQVLVEFLEYNRNRNK